MYDGLPPQLRWDGMSPRVSKRAGQLEPRAAQRAQTLALASVHDALLGGVESFT